MFPKVIFSDIDLVLLNSFSNVFPEATNLLCRFNNNKNVKLKCKMLVDSKVLGICYGCMGLCDAFMECVKCFEVFFSPWPLFFEYVNDTWIIPYKEKFV